MAERDGMAVMAGSGRQAPGPQCNALPDAGMARSPPPIITRNKIIHWPPVPQARDFQDRCSCCTPPVLGQQKVPACTLRGRFRFKGSRCLPFILGHLSAPD